MQDANLAQWIEEEANGEPIEAIVIGEMGCDDYRHDHVPLYADQPKGIILSWDTARPLLDYDFDSGYGAPECNAIYAWTASRVIFISQYDGSTRPCSIPRHPTNVFPTMPGGG